LAARGDTPLSPEQRAFLVPHLIVALYDEWAAVRWFARRSLLDLDRDLARAGRPLGMAEALERLDYIGPAAEREAVATDLLVRWKRAAEGGWVQAPERSLLDARLLPLKEEITRLLRSQASKAIQIGE
jgi:hypothetical protein